MAATAARAETLFLRWTRDRIPSETIVIRENIRQKMARKAARNAATELTEPISY